MIDGNEVKKQYLTSTIVGVGLGGKTCIAVNDSTDARHKNGDANAATSVKIWTSNAESTSTTFVQTTAIVHPTPPS